MKIALLFYAVLQRKPCALHIFTKHINQYCVLYLKIAPTSLHRKYIFNFFTLELSHWPSLHLLLTEVSTQVQLYFRKEVPVGHACNGFGHSHSHLDSLSTLPLRLQRFFIFFLQSQSQVSGFHSSLLLRPSQCFGAPLHSHVHVLSLNHCKLVLHDLLKACLHLHSQVPLK